MSCNILQTTASNARLIVHAYSRSLSRFVTRSSSICHPILHEVKTHCLIRTSHNSLPQPSSLLKPRRLPNFITLTLPRCQTCPFHHPRILACFQMSQSTITQKRGHVSPPFTFVIPLSCWGLHTHLAKPLYLHFYTLADGDHARQRSQRP